MFKAILICAIFAAAHASSDAKKEEDQQPVKRSSSGEVYVGKYPLRGAVLDTGKEAVVLRGAGYGPQSSYQQYYTAPYQVRQYQPYRETYRYGSPSRYYYNSYQSYRPGRYVTYATVPAAPATTYYTTVPRSTFGDDFASVNYFGAQPVATPYRVGYTAPQVTYQVNTDDSYQYATFGTTAAAKYRPSYYHSMSSTPYYSTYRSTAPYSYHSSVGAYPSYTYGAYAI